MLATIFVVHIVSILYLLMFFVCCIVLHLTVDV
jgi:hypothetical protein